MTCTSERADETVNMVIALGGGCMLYENAVMKDSSGRQLYRNILTTDFAQAFQNDHKCISDTVQWDWSAAWSSYAIQQPYHPAAQDWLPIEAKQGWSH